jgi:quaternary ammonium compound-resistance protein SugE
MPWAQLLIAGLFEIVWAAGLKYTEGFTRLAPSVATILAMVLSFYFLAQAVRVLPVGTAYAVWTGIGAVGIALFGIVFLGEPRTVLRIGFILMIVGGIVGLKFTSGP